MPNFTLRNHLRLRPMNVLIGANGSGKSSFLEVFSFLRSVLDGRLAKYVELHGGADRILHFGRRRTPELTIEIWFELDEPDWFTGYGITLAPTDADRLISVRETKLLWNPPEYKHPFDADFAPEGAAPSGVRPTTSRGTPKARTGEAEISVDLEPEGEQIEHGSKWHLAWNLRQGLRSWRCFQFHDTSRDSPMKRTCDVHDNRFLREDGANLAAYLYRLRKTDAASYATICRTVRLAAPFFEDFQLEPLALNAEKIRLEWRHRGSEDYFDASSLSDGTLRFIALTTLLMQPVELRPQVILIDEPELGLHPYAIGLLASMIRSASVETQVVVATQSPILLDHFEPEDVLVAGRTNEETTLRRLEAAPLKEWLEDYSLGELWEKNELGGRPGSE